MQHAAANLRAGVATPEPQVDLPIVAAEESEQTNRMMSGSSTNLSFSGDSENPFLGSLKESGNMKTMAIKQQQQLYVMYCYLRYSI